MTARQPDPQSREVAFVRVLGPVALVAASGAIIEVPSTTQRRLLALLAIRDRTLRSDYLVEVLELSPGALRKSVSRLRALVGEHALHTDPAGYRLDLDVDAKRFTAVVRRAHDARDKVALLDDALSLWHGEALEEFRFEPWAEGEATRLSELRNTAVEDRVQALIELSRLGEATASIAHHIADHPLSDRPRALLMRALAASGRQADALRAYQTYRSLLAEQVGTEPSAELQQTERRIAKGWDGRESATRLPSPGHDRPMSGAGNLPVPGSDWIGSTDSLKRTIEELPTRRLVTLTGPGGVGKTRSAIEIGHASTAAFHDGVWMIELSALRVEDDVATSFADTVGISAQSGCTTVETIVDWLRGRSMLLIVDNCEHLRPAVARLVDAIVRGCETVTVLATSRERLAVRGERVVVVQPLDPTDSVNFFCDRARSSDDSLSFSDDDLVTVSAICERLDRLPLAIELAAARARSLSLNDLLARLEDRFSLLRSEQHNAIDHHERLVTAVRWSYQLLSDDEQVLFNRSSIFAGTLDLAALEAVCGYEPIERDQVVHLLGSLVDKSMITVDRHLSGVRYRLLETLRQFGHERLRETDDGAKLKTRHLDHYVRVAEAAAKLWFSPDQLRADDIFDAEWDNLRVALATAFDSRDLAGAERLLAATITHAHHRVRSEHGEWSESLLALTDVDDRCRVQASGWAAWWAMIAGDHHRALALSSPFIDVDRPAGDSGVALCRSVSAFASWSLRRRIEVPEVAECVRKLEASIPYLDTWTAYNALRTLFGYSVGGGFDSAAQQIEVLTQSVGSPSMTASTRFCQAVAKVYGTQPDLDAAVRLHEQGVALARSARSDLSESQNLQGLLQAKVAQDAPDVLDVCESALRRMFDLRYWLWLWEVVDVATWLLAKHGITDSAALVLGHLEAHVPSWHLDPRASTRALLADRPGTEAQRAIGASMGREAVLQHLIGQISRCPR